MREILNDINIEYTEADGEAAFYGPSWIYRLGMSTARR